MNKEFIAHQASARSGQKIKTSTIDAIIAVIMDGVAGGEEVKIKGFGSFMPFKTKERKARNMSTGETVVVPSCKVAKFKPSKVFTAQLNK